MSSTSACNFTHTLNLLVNCFVHKFKKNGGAEMIEWFAFAGMILGASAGMFGTYALGFYDGLKDGERIGGHPSASHRS
jgi:hypothetical protein